MFHHREGPQNSISLDAGESKTLNWSLDPSQQLPLTATRRRRRRSLGNWRRLRSGGWQFRIRGFTPQGAPFELSRVCSDEQRDRVRSELVSLAEKYRAGLDVPEARITLEVWKTRCVRDYHIRWAGPDRSTWMVLRPLFHHTLQSIDAPAVNQWVSKVLYKGPGKPPHGKASPGYLRRAWDLLRRLVREARARKVLLFLPWGDCAPASIPKYRTAHKLRSPLDPPAISALLDAARGSKVQSLYVRFSLSLATGARPIELSRAMRSMLVPIESIPEAPLIPGAGVLRLPSCKGGLEHDVPISPDIYALVVRWWASLPPEAQATGLLAPRLYRGKWEAQRCWIKTSTWKALCEQAGLSPAPCLYALRHTRLSQIANNPILGPRAAQAIAGHCDVRTTERYTGRARGLIIAAFDSPICETTDPNPPKSSKTRKTRPLLSTRATGMPSKARSRGALRTALQALKQAQEAVNQALLAVPPAYLAPPVAAPAPQKEEIDAFSRLKSA